MDDDPHLEWGLRPVSMADQPLISPYFASLSEPLSDYTFSQLYTWRNSLRILWTQLHNHLCVFANGTGDLTLLMPPIGDSSTDRALAEAFELMDAYNAAHGVPNRSRVEYASDELLSRINCDALALQPMGADYVYDVQRMVDLQGGDLSSKRQAKNRFMRNYQYRVEPYDAARHLEPCRQLLDTWKIHQDAQHLEESNSNSIKRQKESIATDLTLQCASELGLAGMVVYVRDSAEERREDGAPSNDGWSIRAFTFGEWLGTNQSSITIEKTDLGVKGLAQYIFSEFCRTCWQDRPLVNVGDDWGLESLAWTKMSYRPVKMLRKSMFKRVAAVKVALPATITGAPDLITPAEMIGYSDELSPLNASMLDSSPLATLLPLGNASPIEAPASLDNLTPLEVLPGLDNATPLETISSSNVSAENEIRETPVEDRVVEILGIRRAAREDLAAVIQLEQSCFSAHCLNKRQLQYLQSRSGSPVGVQQTTSHGRSPSMGSVVFLVAEYEGRVVGEGIGLTRQHKRGCSGRIYSLAVDPAHRGKRIGLALLDAVIRQLSDRGASRVYLEVEDQNHAAIRLYQSSGFGRIGVLPNYYGLGKAAIHMMRQVPALPTLFDNAKSEIVTSNVR